ncbi:MAG: L-seryl-tRNA(Sec) selenium transferase, partial [Verrucomicrobiia bacterium]
LIRKHPLMRAVRVDKTCLMVLERTLQLFRKPDQLARLHPTYCMLTTPMEVLQTRARRLLELIQPLTPKLLAKAENDVSYLGSGSLPTQAIPSAVVTVEIEGLSASELAKRLRLDDACVFARIEEDRVCIDMRTIADAQIDAIAQALQRAANGIDTPQANRT